MARPRQNHDPARLYRCTTAFGGVHPTIGPFHFKIGDIQPGNNPFVKGNPRWWEPIDGGDELERVNATPTHVEQ